LRTILLYTRFDLARQVHFCSSFIPLGMNKFRRVFVDSADVRLTEGQYNALEGATTNPWYPQSWKEKQAAQAEINMCLLGREPTGLILTFEHEEDLIARAIRRGGSQEVNLDEVCYKSLINWFDASSS
jgi:hypothetical protein